MGDIIVNVAILVAFVGATVLSYFVGRNRHYLAGFIDGQRHERMMLKNDQTRGGR